MASGFPGRTPTPRLLLREGLKPNTLLPSKFQTEKILSMKKEASTGSTGRSFLPSIGPCIDMSETRQKPPRPERNVLVVSPAELVFHNFVAGEVSEMVLTLINQDKISRMVKVSMGSCPYFQLACPSDVMVPPRASAPVRIRFSPDENKDYSHELTCTTANEELVVPIQAIGARGVQVLPAQLDFSECPVKHSTQKTLLVRNLSHRPVYCQLSTQSPFSVVPTSGIVRSGGSMRVTVRFHALTSGEHFGSLCCNTGDKSIHTKLHGDAVELDVVLSTNSVEADKTFITMSSQTSVFIENRSNITAHFQWKAFLSEGEENKEKRRQCRLLHPPSEVRQEKFMEEKEIEKEKGFCEDHAALLRSRVQEKKAKVQEDPLLFSSDIFFIEPMEGEIGPNCSAEIKVTFKPLEALEYQSVAYCNVSGREIRLPLCLRGKGQGPLVELSSPTLNLGKIFIDTSYVYEVELINQGALDAPFTYIPSATDVDFGFKFEPEQGIIAPGGTQTVQISFHTTTELGSFEEKFHFSVAGSSTPVILTIKGSVTGLDLHFDLPELDFGDISFDLQWEKALQRNIELILQMDEDEYDALPEEKKAEVDKKILERKRIRRKKELQQMAQKREEEGKALEEEERWKKEKKGVSVGKQLTKPEKRKTKPPEKKEIKAPEGKEIKSERKETKAPERKETKAPEKKENKAPEKKETKIREKKNKPPEKKESKIPEKQETKILKKETEPPEKKYKPPEKETKSPKRKETKIREKETKTPKKGEAKAPEKGEPKTSKKGETKAPEKGGTKAQKKGGTKAPKKGGTEIPEDAAEMENLILMFQIYESLQQNFSYWNRVQGTTQVPVIQKGNKFQHAAGNKGQKTNKPQEKVKKKPEQKCRDQRNL